MKINQIQMNKITRMSVEKTGIFFNRYIIYKLFIIINIILMEKNFKYLDYNGLRKLVDKLKVHFQKKISDDGETGQVLTLENGEMVWKDGCKCPKIWSFVDGAPTTQFQVNYTTVDDQPLNLSTNDYIVNFGWDYDTSTGYIIFNATGIPAEFFYLNENLKTIEIEEPCPKIGTNAFRGALNLEQVEIPSSVKSLSAGAFQNNQNLTSITIPESIKVIPEKCFTGSHKPKEGYEGSYEGGLTNINLPETLEEIGDEAFEDCTSLTDVKMPVNVKKIGKRAFQQCINLKFQDWDFWDNIEELGDACFQSCHILNFEDRTLKMPKNITVIPKEAFSYIYSIRDIDLSNVESVGQKAFMCTRQTYEHSSSTSFSIVNIYIPSSVKFIGKQAFAGTSDKDIYVDDGSEYRHIRVQNIKIDDINDYVQIEFEDSRSHPNTEKYYSQLLDKNGSYLKNVEITAPITTLGSRMFAGMDIYLIKLPETIENIESRAFTDCRYLQDIDLSNLPNLQTVGGRCFSLNSAAYKKTISFKGCSRLTTLGDNLLENTTVDVLDLSGCESLTLTDKVFEGSKKIDTIILSDTDNVTDIPSSIPANNIIANNCGFTTIKHKAFAGNTTLETIDLSNCEKLTTVGGDGSTDAQQFSGCNSLKTVNLSGCTNLTTIGYKAFEKTDALEEVNLSGCTNLTTIGTQAFYGGDNSYPGLGRLDLSECTALTTLGEKALCPLYKLIVSDTAAYLNQLYAATTKSKTPNLQRLFIKGTNKVAEGLYDGNTDFYKAITYYVDPLMIEEYRSTYPALSFEELPEYY